MSPACIAEWSEFQPVTVSTLKDIVQKLKPTFFVNNMIPSCFLKQVIDCALSLEYLINKRLLDVWGKCGVYEV